MRLSYIIYAAFLLFTTLTLLDCRVLARDITFPADAGQLNVKDYGAVGDGITDDTKAFRKAIEENYTFCGGRDNNYRFLYVPDGTYLVSNTIFWMRWVTFQGQSEEGTVIKLKDNCPGYQDPATPQPVVRCRFTGLSCSPSDGSNNSSFANYIQNLTVDIGRGNPGAIGIQYNNHNEGAIRNVTIRSSDPEYAGAIGLDMAETEFGPGLIKNVSIEGFDLGIKTPALPSHATFENLRLANQQRLGMRNNLPASIHRFSSENTVPAIENGESVLAQLVIVEGTFTGGASDTSAIVNTGGGTVVLRNLASSGYRGLLVDGDNEVGGSAIDEYITGEKNQLFGQPTEHLKLAIEEAPPVLYEPTENWVLVDPSEADDTESIQRAIDSGARTIYFQFGAQYVVSSPIVVRGNVERIVGMNATVRAFQEDFNGGTDPIFRLENEQPLAVEFLITNQFPNFKYNAFEINTTQPVFLKSCLTVRNNTVTNTAASAGGKLFLEDTHMNVDLPFPMQVWVRHYNVENNPAGEDTDLAYHRQVGGSAWILGMKTEGIATHVDVSGGAAVEVLGGFFRDQINYNGLPPYFKIVESSVSAAYWQYDCCGGRTRNITAITIQNGDSTAFETTQGNHIVGVLRIGEGDDNSQSTVGDPLKGEVGISSTDDNYQQVALAQSYQTPRVFVGPLSYNGTQPATIRVRNAESNSFEWRVDEWEYTDQFHLLEEVSYIVVEEGTASLGDSMLVQSGSAEVSTEWVPVRFENTFASKPIVLPQVVTENEAEAVVVRIKNVTTAGFEILLQEEEGGNPQEAGSRAHAAETVHWIAIEATTLTNSVVSGSFVASGLNSEFSPLASSQSFDPDSAVFLSHTQSTYGSDPGSIRYVIEEDGLRVSYQEETSQDAEVNYLDEEIGVVRFEQAMIFNQPIASTPTTVPSDTDEPHVRVFPNPVLDILKVELDTEHPTTASVVLLDKVGNVLSNGVLSPEGFFRLDMALIRPGTYYLRVRSEELSTTRRVVK